MIAKNVAGRARCQRRARGEDVADIAWWWLIVWGVVFAVLLVYRLGSDRAARPAEEEEEEG